MLHLRVAAVLIVEPLNHVTDGAGDEFHNLEEEAKTQSKHHLV